MLNRPGKFLAPGILPALNSSGPLTSKSVIDLFSRQDFTLAKSIFRVRLDRYVVPLVLYGFMPETLMITSDHAVLEFTHVRILLLSRTPTFILPALSLIQIRYLVQGSVLPVMSFKIRKDAARSFLPNNGQTTNNSKNDQCSVRC